MSDRPLTWDESGKLVERTESLGERQARAAAEEFARLNPAPPTDPGLRAKDGGKAPYWHSRPFPKLAIEDKGTGPLKWVLFLFVQLPLLIVAAFVAGLVKLPDIILFGPTSRRSQ